MMLTTSRNNLPQPLMALPLEPYVMPCFAVCDVLRQLALNDQASPTDYVREHYSWCPVGNFTFGLYSELWGASRPRFVMAKLGGDKFDNLIVCFRETKGAADWFANTQAFGSFDVLGGDAVYSGNMHSAFRARSKLIPLGPMAEHLEKGGRLFITGYSQGSAVGEAFLIRLMNTSFWKPQFISQVLFVGFASPLLYDEVLAEELLHSHVRGPGQTICRGDVFHHFVYRQDIVPRLLRLVGEANRALSSTLESWLNGAGDAKIVSKEVLDLALPSYHPGGHWHLLHGQDGVKTLDAKNKKDVEILLAEVFPPTRSEDGVLDLKAKHLQHHGLNHYYRELSQLLLIDVQAKAMQADLPACVRIRGEDVTVTAAWHSQCSLLEISIRGVNVGWCDSVCLHAHGQTKKFQHSDIQIRSRNEVLVVWSLQRAPSSAVDVHLTFAIGTERFQIRVVPETIGAEGNVREYFKMQPHDEVKESALSLILLSEDSVRKGRIVRSITHCLSTMMSSLPVEMLFVPLAKGDPMKALTIEYLCEHEPPVFKMMSEVGLTVLAASITTLKNVPRKELEGEALEKHFEALADLATSIEWVGEANRRYIAHKLIHYVGVSANIAYLGWASGFSVPLQTVLALTATTIVAAGGLVRVIKARRLNDIDKALLDLESSFSKMTNSWDRAGCNHFCGLTLGDVAPSFVDDRIDSICSKLLVAEERALEVKKKYGPASAQAKAAQKESLQELTKSLFALDGLFELLSLFFSDAEGDYGLGITATPSSWWKSVPKGFVSVFGGALHGVIGGLVGGINAAWKAEKSPLIEYVHGFYQLGRWVNNSATIFRNYEEYVRWLAEYLAMCLGESVAKDTWSAESYLVHYLANQTNPLSASLPTQYVLANWENVMGKAFANYPAHFRFELLCRLRHLQCFHELREWLCKVPLLGIFGPSNVGKTYLMNKILSRGTRDRINVPRPGQRLSRRTSYPRIYAHPLNPSAFVLDTAGIDDPEVLRYSQPLMSIPKVVVLLVPASVHVLSQEEVGKFLRITANEVVDPNRIQWAACLTAITKADELFEKDEITSLEPLIEEEEDRPLSHDFPVCIKNRERFPRWWVCLDLSRSVFQNSIPEHLRFHHQERRKGIHSCEDVLKWIDSQLGIHSP